LRGAAKPAVDAVLSLIWLVLLLIALVLYQWKAALFALVLSFVYGAATKPLAKTLARHFLGYRTTLSSGIEDKMDYSVEGMFRRIDERDRRVKRIATRPEISKVLADNGLTPGDLDEQLGFLLAAGLGDLSWELLSSPADLERLLRLRKSGV